MMSKGETSCGEVSLLAICKQSGSPPARHVNHDLTAKRDKKKVLHFKGERPFINFLQIKAS